MRIALAQFNSHVANFSQNGERIRDAIDEANRKNCDLVVFPELALFGYNPVDLLERDELISQQDKELEKIKKHIPKNMHALVGGVTRTKNKKGKPYHNSVHLIGKKKKTFHKELLPSYDVFDDTRFMQSGDVNHNLFTLKGYKVLVLICEDIWCWDGNRYENILTQVKTKKPDLVICVNASPFSYGKQERRIEMARTTAKYFRSSVVYLNMVGAQDELIFDGRSFVIDKKGTIIAQSAAFSEDLNVIDLGKAVGGRRETPSSKVELLHGALVLGLRDFAAKNNLKRMHLGLSGGIDSAVVACLAADAIGPANVSTIAMPGPFSSIDSLKFAEQLAKNIGCEFSKLSINSIYEAELNVFEETFGKLEFGLVHENLQARLRATLLMMYANYKHSLLLSTSNKSEMAVGYTTLYGDMCGGIAPLGDVLKKEVYELAKFYNQHYELIPEQIISRPPSAELRPNQKDEDSLPPYDQLDKAVQKIVTEEKPARGALEKMLLNMLAKSEFKRWQAPPILKVSEHAFGRGRRWPISHGAYTN